jgi:GMP synthase-like glutamine amidotransferase
MSEAGASSSSPTSPLSPVTRRYKFLLVANARGFVLEYAGGYSEIIRDTLVRAKFPAQALSMVDLAELRPYEKADYASAMEHLMSADLGSIDGLIISGGGAMVTDKTAEWLQAEIEWVRSVVLTHPTLPVLGICLGHQIMAVAAGGEVDWLPDGPIRAYSNIETKCEKTVSTCPVFSCLAEQLQLCQLTNGVFEYHSQGVLKAPASATVVAATPGGDQFQALKYNCGKKMSCQFHPDYTIRYIAHVCDPAFVAQLRAQPGNWDASSILVRRFFEFAMHTTDADRTKAAAAAAGAQ